MNEYFIENELRAGEKLLWKGKPATGIRLQPSDAFNIPFSLLWGGFAIFWETMALTMPSKQGNGDQAVAAVFPIFGIPFVLIGLYMIIGRFFVDARVRANTDYAVTNERAIIVSGLFSRKIKSLNLKSIPDISLSEKADGSGTITFGASSGWAGGRNSFPGMANNQLPAFVMIPDARTVYALLGKTQRSE